MRLSSKVREPLFARDFGRGARALTRGSLSRGAGYAAGLLRRDPRVVERKKYGRKKARKRFTWSVFLSRVPVRVRMRRPGVADVCGLWCFGLVAAGIRRVKR